jgi:hypothetical protein
MFADIAARTSDLATSETILIFAFVTLHQLKREIKLSLTVKNVVFWSVALCRCCANRRFGGTYRLHLQDLHRSTQRHIPEDEFLHSHRSESLKSFISLTVPPTVSRGLRMRDPGHQFPQFEPHCFSCFKTLAWSPCYRQSYECFIIGTQAQGSRDLTCVFPAFRRSEL